MGGNGYFCSEAFGAQKVTPGDLSVPLLAVAIETLGTQMALVIEWPTVTPGANTLRAHTMWIRNAPEGGSRHHR